MNHPFRTGFRTGGVHHRKKNFRTTITKCPGKHTWGFFVYVPTHTQALTSTSGLYKRQHVNYCSISNHCTLSQGHGGASLRVNYPENFIPPPTLSQLSNHTLLPLGHIYFCRSSPSPNRRKMSDRKAVIKNADMSEEMQQDAVDCATQALEKYNIEKVRPPKCKLYGRERVSEILCGAHAISGEGTYK